MATVVVTKAHATLGSDVLDVSGTVDGAPVIAQGWVSATSNFYPPDDYCPGNGSHMLAPAGPNNDPPEHRCDTLHLLDGSLPRAMTRDEKMAYCESLLAAAAPQTPPTPVDIFA